MRITKILAFIVFALTVICCSKSDDPSNDNIVFENIDKTITFSNIDSIQGNCKDLIFEILKSDENQYTTIIKLNNLVISCDGFNNISLNTETGRVELLDENQEIFVNNNWGSANNANLDDFAGKGEKYIAYRSGFFPLSTKRYNYGWIKIDLSENKQTLRIISRATNYSDNLSIKTGQK